MERSSAKKVFSHYKLILVPLLLLLTSSAASSLECRGSVHISSDGETINQLKANISAAEGYYYPSNSEFGFSVPKNSKIKLVSHEGQEITFETRITTNLYKRVDFTTTERIEGNENYGITIKYSVKHGSIIYGDKALLHQMLPTSSCPGSSQVRIHYPDSWQFNRSELNDYVLKDNELIFRAYNRTKPAQAWFNVNKSSSELVNFQSGILNVTVPELYQDKIRRQTQIADNLLPEIEEKTGIESPEGFQIKYLPLKSSNIGEEVAGQYYSGKIQIASTQLAYTEEYGLETLLHEIVHGYSDKISGKSPDWWWEEGIANYVTHSVMKESGYDIRIFEPSETSINETFEHCRYSRSFISDWSPVDSLETTIRLAYPCKGKKSVEVEGEKIDLITNKDRLGYRYSELIVKQIFNNTDQDVSSVYNLMQRRNVSFSDSRGLINNQINFFASKVTGKNLTRFLREKGVKTDSWITEYRKLEKAEIKLDKIDSIYSFTDLNEIREDLSREKNKFYRGHFSTTNADNIIERAEELNQSLSKIEEKYQDVRTNINKLENKKEPKFYESYKKELEDALNLANKQEWEKALNKISEVNSSAFERRNKIQEYQRNADKTESMIKDKLILVKPFLLSARQDLTDSRELFSQGKLKKANNQLNTSNLKLNLAPFLALIFYSVILSGGYILITRFREADGENWSPLSLYALLRSDI